MAQNPITPFASARSSFSFSPSSSDNEISETTPPVSTFTSARSSFSSSPSNHNEFSAVTPFASFNPSNADGDDYRGSNFTPCSIPSPVSPELTKATSSFFCKSHVDGLLKLVREPISSTMELIMENNQGCLKKRKNDVKKK